MAYSNLSERLLLVIGPPVEEAIIVEMVSSPPYRSLLRRLLGIIVVTCSAIHSTSAKPPDTTEITRLQVFLDNHHFSPGSIDGQYGTFTKRALAYYNTQQQRKPSDWRTAHSLSEQQVPIAFVTHQITPEDQRWIGTVPKDLGNQAKLRALPYTSLVEYVAERYHADQRFLQRLNPQLDLDLLKSGDLVVVPNVKHVFRIEAMPRSKRYRAHAKRVDCYAFINTKQRMAGLYRGTKLVAAFPITHGRAQFVPRGDWKIQTMLTTPSFRWDERMLKEGQRSESFHLLPPGPNNPVGILWAGINKPGIGLHGTNSPETIGRAYSAGCIRFANWDAIRLPKFLCPGSAVIVR
ncbi:MAG: L,D-transpeptidase [Verrucomicrobiales bacterium]|nr:L,D-transpeptidase [Verrucomicrobiales bacterium]MDA7643704.1 L,D-transpeptidase [Verrucomicrobiales bacterium]MDF1789394.1 L,D-transpeptidase [Verrucomicrobiales bacterium]